MAFYTHVFEAIMLVCFSVAADIFIYYRNKFGTKNANYKQY